MAFVRELQQQETEKEEKRPAETSTPVAKLAY